MISTDFTSETLDWSSLEGTTLEGGYQVGELLSADSRSAVFKIRVLGEYGRHAVATFYRAAGSVAQEQLDLWTRARAIRHPNLSVPLGAGFRTLEGSQVVYVVTDKPGEVLSGVLQKRELVPEEADEILRSVARALQELHGRNLVHGTVSPDRVFAFGDSIKLSAEDLRKSNFPPPLTSVPAKYLAPESAGENTTPEADVWCLGAMLFEALTQKHYGPESAEAAAGLPEPWNRILPKCLEPDPAQRARLAGIDGLRTGQPVREEPISAAPLVVESPAPAGSTASEQELSSVAKRHSVTPVERTFHTSRSWIYAAVALVAIIVLLLIARPKHPPAPATAVAQPASSWPTRTLSPDTAPRHDAHPDARVAERKPAVAGTPANPAIWRVVLYAFSRQADAQEKVQTINKQHPDLNTSVFTPSSRNRMYLVVAGGPMTRDQAARLRQEALRQGMPHDSYIQNYRQ